MEDNQEYDIYDLGFNKYLSKSQTSLEDSSSTEPLDVSSILGDGLSGGTSPVNIESGEIVGNLTIKDGYIQSSNYVLGTTGWRLSPTSIEFNTSITINGYVEDVGGDYSTASLGARMEIFPDSNTGLIVYDDNISETFKIIVGGSYVGDIILGSEGSGKYVKWDKSAAL